MGPLVYQTTHPLPWLTQQATYTRTIAEVITSVFMRPVFSHSGNTFETEFWYHVYTKYWARMKHHHEFRQKFPYVHVPNMKTVSKYGKRF